MDGALAFDEKAINVRHGDDPPAHVGFWPNMLIVEFARTALAYEAPPLGSTRDRLIVAAERLFAQQSIEGPSLRMISAEAGQGNTRALQYHFGGRRGILAAILLTRLGSMERRRSELLAAAVAHSRTLEIKDILAVLLRPLTEIVDSDGHNMFVRVLAQILMSTHSLEQYYVSRLETPAGPDRCATATEEALEMLAAHAPSLSKPQLATRLTHVLRMFVGAIIDRESSLFAGAPCPTLEETMAEQFQMCAAALCA